MTGQAHRVGVAVLEHAALGGTEELGRRVAHHETRHLVEEGGKRSLDMLAPGVGERRFSGRAGLPA